MWSESEQENSNLENPDDEYLPNPKCAKKTEIVDDDFTDHDSSGDSVGSMTPSPGQKRTTRNSTRKAKPCTRRENKKAAGMAPTTPQHPKPGNKRTRKGSIKNATAMNHDAGTAGGSTTHEPLSGKRTRKGVEKDEMSTNDGNKVSRKLLRKDQRATIIDSIKTMSLNTIAHEVKLRLHEQLQSSEQILKVILDSLVDNEKLLLSLVKHHHNTFVNLYVQCSSGKEKYIRFQLDWHKHCSVFLLPRVFGIDCIFLSNGKSTVTDSTKENAAVDNTKEISDIRCLWLNFCDSQSYPLVSCNKLMILFSAAVYDILLQQMHKNNAKLTTAAVSTGTPSTDSDDVYICIGGATLSSMLHIQYKDIRKCHHEERRDILSQEIQILQAINTKDKSDMPQYLQYRDRGCMYMPNRTFVPFFRCIDECVREVVNQSGFQDHGNELIQVYSIKYS